MHQYLLSLRKRSQFGFGRINQTNIKEVIVRSVFVVWIEFGGLQVILCELKAHLVPFYEYVVKYGRPYILWDR